MLSRAASAATVDAPGVPAGSWRDVARPARRFVSDGQPRRLHRRAARRRHLLPGGQRHACRSDPLAALARSRSSSPAAARASPIRCPIRPATPFTPGDPGSGGYGSGSGGGGAGIPPGPPMCDTSRPPLRARLQPTPARGRPLTGHEKTVTLIGDYRTDSWTSGDPATFDGSKWTVTVADPVGHAQVTYKFHITYDDGTADELPARSVQPHAGRRRLRRQELGLRRHHLRHLDLRLDADRLRRQAPLAAGSFDWRDAVLYFAFVDRFNNGDGTNDAPISDAKLTGTAANWQGGDWTGLHAKITDGYFAALGVNTLWITVPIDNAESVGQGDRRRHVLVHRLPRLLAARSRPRPSRASAASAELHGARRPPRTPAASRSSSTTR